VLIVDLQVFVEMVNAFSPVLKSVVLQQRVALMDYVNQQDVNLLDVLKTVKYVLIESVWMIPVPCSHVIRLKSVI
jgi:hypothetical protein